MIIKMIHDIKVYYNMVLIKRGMVNGYKYKKMNIKSPIWAYLMIQMT